MSLNVVAWGNYDNPASDSYVSVAEADAYIIQREGFDPENWQSSLSISNREWRLKVATLLVDSSRYRGIRATKQQARSFPRIFPTTPHLWFDELSVTEPRFSCTDELLDYLSSRNSLNVIVTPGVVPWEDGDVILIRSTYPNTITVNYTGVANPTGKGTFTCSLVGVWPIENITCTVSGSPGMFTCSGPISGSQVEIDCDTEAVYYFYDRPPNLPNAIKYATIELAYQVVGQYMSSQFPYATSEAPLRSLTVGKLSLDFGDKTLTPEPDLFNQMRMSSTTIINLHLREYIQQLRISLI